jgi:hypothetical protein
MESGDFPFTPDSIKSGATRFGVSGHKQKSVSPIEKAGFSQVSKG